MTPWTREPQNQARHYIERYFERFQKVREFMDDLVGRARNAGAAETVLGRRRPIPNIRSKSFRLRSAAERVAQNMPMQGSAADIMKLAMLAADREVSRLPYPAPMLLTVHDELLFEVAPEHAEELRAVVKTAMESAFELSVPLEVDTGIADNWADAH